MDWKTILLVVIGLLAVIGIAILFGLIRWRSATTALLAALNRARAPSEIKTYSSGELTALPAAVQRYFRSVLREGQSIISAARFEQSGIMNLSAKGEQWKPFTASQAVVTRRPGFVWSASVVMMPGLIANVHDAYVAGAGILHAALFGLITVAKARNTPEAAHGELLRFLAEAIWYPTALLPSQGIRWESVDASSARATLKDSPNQATLLFRFDSEGLIESVHADGRERVMAGQVVPTPWEARCADFQWREGVRIPLACEVSWMLPTGRSTYWRGRIGRLSYELAG